MELRLVDRRYGAKPCGGRRFNVQTAREASREPSEVTDLAARGLHEASQRGPAP
jgi:hypothetical protein